MYFTDPLIADHLGCAYTFSMINNASHSKGGTMEWKTAHKHFDINPHLVKFLQVKSLG